MAALRLNLLLSLFVLVLVLGLLSSSTESIRFEVTSGSSKCVTEDISVDSLTVGKYHVVSTNDGAPSSENQTITAQVLSIHGHYHYAERVESGQFAFMVTNAGEYMTCFWANHRKPETTLTVDFEWRTGIVTREGSVVAKKDEVEKLEMELMDMQAAVSFIYGEMNYLRTREKELQEHNETTNDTMFWLSFLSLVICIAVVLLQVWHLKAFFEKKKLI